MFVAAACRFVLMWRVAAFVFQVCRCLLLISLPRSEPQIFRTAAVGFGWALPVVLHHALLRLLGVLRLPPRRVLGEQLAECEGLVVGIGGPDVHAMQFHAPFVDTRQTKRVSW